MEERHLASAINILKTIHYLTIATVDEDGSPWNSPVSVSIGKDFTFSWGSSPDNTHSRNIRRDGRVFAVVYNSTVPEGTGEGVYMKGTAEELSATSGVVSQYRFTPEKAWINDEAKNEDGSYRHDIRVELDLGALREGLN